MADPRNFLLDSDYPLDQVVYMASGSYTSTTSGAGDISQIAHGLPFRPLLVGKWSLKSDFSTSRECYLPIYTDINGIYVQAFSNDTTITISSINFTGASKTVYWQVYGFMPSNVNVDASFTSANADIFAFNSDYNYTKLYYNDIVTASASTTITHNFGYRPQTMAWLKDISIYGTGMVNVDTYVKVTTSDVIVTSASKDVHLRIYADSQL